MAVPAEGTAAPGGGNVLHQITRRLPYLPSALRQIAEYLVAHPTEAQAMTITQLASACGVAESTVSRFVREMGLESYHTLRVGLAEARFAATRTAAGGGEAEFVYEGILRDDAAPAIIGKIERSSRQALTRTARQVDAEALAEAAALLDEANALVFCSMGASGIAAEEGVMRFTRAGKKCLHYRDQSVQMMVATVLAPGDVLIAISDSGQTTAVVEATRLAVDRGAATIAITAAPKSPLARLADVPLFTSNVEGAGLYGESVTSKWGQLLLVDILYATYAARHFDETLHTLQETYEAGIRHSRGRRRP
ncbi:MurR/RpiR family transcriptional regulator [Streptomyces sp. HUAS MG91]|uniref:MurR/RpiR family transcriptional regulator n=1 Tax=Streptomyces tabacisoli TaxID=3156398 RepID=A0AAU8J3R8_9ACTN